MTSPDMINGIYEWLGEKAQSAVFALAQIEHSVSLEVEDFQGEIRGVFTEEILRSALAAQKAGLSKKVIEKRVIDRARYETDGISKRRTRKKPGPKVNRDFWTPAREAEFLHLVDFRQRGRGQKTQRQVIEHFAIVNDYEWPEKLPERKTNQPELQFIRERSRIFADQIDHLYGQLRRIRTDVRERRALEIKMASLHGMFDDILGYREQPLLNMHDDLLG